MELRLPNTRSRDLITRICGTIYQFLYVYFLFIVIYGQHHCGKGRNARGIITARHRGGGHKRLYRKIDFRRNVKDIYGRIVTIEYD
ncbi:hypothetical protein CDL12_24969 [Handroanthus impetiginosus]|uniref:Large ribosomal subunit protein uL2 RNA-binding domain-containing protein n=1 Tax=Handroanthus impetiginosus TaxID=429701 RepID=A0A2G9GB55_9LAMI|nr:hypothetical protein CDL12_24969 [Handroanthus impetiginosus]